MRFAEILNELRTEKGLTQKQLAEKIGFSRAIIGFWESGKHEPTESAIVACANYFKVTSDYLVGLEDEYGNKIKPQIEPQKKWIAAAARSGERIEIQLSKAEIDEIASELKRNADKDD